jgi:hypothetical protein
VLQAGSTPIVRTGNQYLRLVAAPNAVIVRDGATAKLTDIRRDDTVDVMITADGMAQRVNATSRHEADPWPWLIPLLVALGIGAVLVVLWVGRRRDSFVLEPIRGDHPPGVHT